MTYIIDRRLFQAGTLTVQQRVSEFLQAISDGADLNAFITVMAESAWWLLPSQTGVLQQGWPGPLKDVLWP